MERFRLFIIAIALIIPLGMIINGYWITQHGQTGLLHLAILASFFVAWALGFNKLIEGGKAPFWWNLAVASPFCLLLLIDLLVFRGGTYNFGNIFVRCVATLIYSVAVAEVFWEIKVRSDVRARDDVIERQDEVHDPRKF